MALANGFDPIPEKQLSDTSKLQAMIAISNGPTDPPSTICSPCMDDCTSPVETPACYCCVGNHVG